jgi:hypothetical protein
MCPNAVSVSLRQYGAACSNMRVFVHVQEVAGPSYEMHVSCYTIILALVCNFVQLFWKKKRNIGRGTELVL